jgi:hypothetical protein
MPNLEIVSQPVDFRPTEKYKQTRAWQSLRRSWVGSFVRSCRGCRRELLALIQSPSVELPDVQQLTKALAGLQCHVAEEAPNGNDFEAPIFLLSTGWRAGSTLLQRILLTDPRLLLWGEPLGEMTIFSRLADMIGHFISTRNSQLWRKQPDPSSPDISRSWIANLYPPGEDFRSGLRNLFNHWLREPARARGFARWGFKEVRLGAVEASFLHWLYPQAKFVIISRHPYDCYRSLADSGWDQIFYKYPDVEINSAVSFARHWNRIAVSWSQFPADFPAVHIKYEDLIRGKVDFRKLESWLGIQIREDAALSVLVGGTTTRTRLSWYERLIIAGEAQAGMHILGYCK